MKIFNRIEGEVPYATLAELSAYTAEAIAKFGEATFDEVIQLTILREKLYQESALMAASTDVIQTRAMDRIEAQIFSPGDTAVQVTYPVPPESIAPTERKEPIQYFLKKVDLDMAETRYFLSNDAKLRGAYEWLREDTVSRAIEHMAETRDEHVLSSLITQHYSTNDVAATATWASASATPENDVAKVISNIIKNSNINTAQINKSPAFAVIIPAAAFMGITKIKLLENITQKIQNFIETSYKVRIVLSRKPLFKTSWPVDTEAIVLPIQDKNIGYLATFDGGGIIPAQEIEKNSRGEDHYIRQWYKWVGIPYPNDGVTTTNRRIGLITGVAA